MEKIIRHSKDGSEGAVLTIEEGNIMVAFENCCEGYCGDYDPDDPEDEELIRFTVWANYGEDDWQEVDDASYCTTIPVNSPWEILEKKIKTIFREYKELENHILSGGSVKKLGETLSWI